MFALEASNRAQIKPIDLRYTQVHENEHTFELCPLYTISPRYRRAVPLCTQMNYFHAYFTMFFTPISRLRSTGKRQQAPFLCNNVKTGTRYDGKLQYSPNLQRKSKKKQAFCTPFCVSRFCYFLNKYRTNWHQTWLCMPVSVHKATEKVELKRAGLLKVLTHYGR